MNEPVWITVEESHAIHSEMLARFGGLDGVRDEGLLESALNRPKNLFAYGCEDLIQMAGAYAAGIIKNHPFLDGNKRTGFLAAALFVESNGMRFFSPEEEVVERTLALAAGAICEEEYTAWLRGVCEPA